MLDAATASLTLAGPITIDELRSQRIARARMDAENAGVHFTADDLPALNAELAAHPAPAMTPTELAHPDADQILLDARRRAVSDAVRAVAVDYIARGITRSAPTEEQRPALTPDPIAWPDGSTFHRTIETAMHEITANDALLAAAAAAGKEPPYTLPELGRLFTEQDVADLFSLSLASLRAWRAKDLHFEWIKFASGRGTVRYTERGLVAFCEQHLHRAEQVTTTGPDQ